MLTVLTGPLVHKVLRVQLGLRVLPEQMELMELILLSLDQRDLKGRPVQRVLLDKMEKRVQPAPKGLKVRLEMTGRMELPELLEPRDPKALLEMMVQTALKAHKVSKVLPGRMEPMALQGRKESKAPLALMEMMGLMALKGHKESKEPQAPKALLALPEPPAHKAPQDRMEMTAHKGHKESKEPQAPKGQPEITVKTVRMETTVPRVPKGHKVYKGHKAQQAQQARREKKVTKAIPERLARKAQLDSPVLLARPEPKAIPESREFKASRGQRVLMVWRLG